MAARQLLKEQTSVETVLTLIAILRGENGCPWDLKQTPETIGVCLIEEVHELLEAIAARDLNAICEELGDVLFQALFIAFLYQQQGHFELTDVLKQNVTKMVQRHPHVFGQSQLENADQTLRQWRQIKEKEKKQQGRQSLMDSVPSGMPALMRAFKLSQKAAGIGFDWDDLKGVMQQTEAEWHEFKAEIATCTVADELQKARTAIEFGDILFTMVNVARIAGIHPETALAGATEKFVKRFKQMEKQAAQKQTTLKAMKPEQLEELWQAAKRQE